ESLRVGTNAGKFLDRRQNVERRSIAVRILAEGECLRLLPPFTAGDVGDELEQHVGRNAERNTVLKHRAQCAPADGKIRRRIDRLDHRIYERRVVSRVYPEAVADGVVEARLLKIKLEVPCLLSRARLVQPGTRLKHGFDRIVARAATLGR